MNRVINIAVPVVISVLLVGILYVVGPHSKGWTVEKPVHWSYVTVTDKPLTYNEDGPYMEGYAVKVYPKEKCTAINIAIKSDKDMIMPEGTLILTVGNNKYEVYPAPFEHFKEADNSVEAYKESVKDNTKVYTAAYKDGGLSVRVVVPNNDIFRDPQNIRESDIGLTGIEDVNGGQMKDLVGHSDWMFMERNGGIVPENAVLSANCAELMDGIKEGESYKFHLWSSYDDINLLDIDNETLSKFIDRFSADGFTTDFSWELDKKNDRIEVTLGNVRDITNDKMSIHVPNGLAHGYKDGIYYSSLPMDLPVERSKEE